MSSVVQLSTQLHWIGFSLEFETLFWKIGQMFGYLWNMNVKKGPVYTIRDSYRRVLNSMSVRPSVYIKKEQSIIVS